MKPALQAILVAPDQQMRTDILSGKKQITIREGWRNYRSGAAVLCCHLEPWAVMTNITLVSCMKLSEVTGEEYRADGYQTQEEMLADLQKYYPDMTMDSPVTVIRWGPVHGALVDSFQQARP